jgi:hypothetical protein
MNSYTITLTPDRPHQRTVAPGGTAYTVGTEATIHLEEGGWFYTLHGVGPTGLWFEADDIGPFPSAGAAEAAARNATEP